MYGKLAAFVEPIGEIINEITGATKTTVNISKKDETVVINNDTKTLNLRVRFKFFHN